MPLAGASHLGKGSCSILVGYNKRLEKKASTRISSIDARIPQRLREIERYHLSRDLAGHPQLVTYVATYPCLQLIPSAQRLRERVKSIVKQFPTFKARIVDARTTKPKWSILSDEQVERGIEALVTDVDLDGLLKGRTGSANSVGVTIDQRVSSDLETIFYHELNNKEGLRIRSGGLLWRVARYHYRESNDPEQPQPAFVAVTINHVVSDGRSGQALLNALVGDMPLRSYTRPSSCPLPLRPRLAPSLESTINCFPSIVYIVIQIWLELVIPALPRFLARLVVSEPCWPAAPPRSTSTMASPKDVQRFDHFHLTSRQLHALKALGKRNGVPTLHPTLQLAAVIAHWIVIDSLAGLSRATKCRDTPSEIVHDTLISVRSSRLGHPSMSGNYISVLENRLRCPTTDTDVNIWSEVRKYASWLHCDEGRKRSLYLLGSLQFIPDRQNRVQDDSPTPTGWEEFLLERAKRAPPESLSVSNLGYTACPPGSIGVAWCESATILQSPFMLNIIVHSEGLDVTFSWMKGAWSEPSCGRDPGDGFAETYRKVLLALSEIGEHDLKGYDETDMTFWDIRARIQINLGEKRE
ncbi:hypothetical protein QFC22_001414 [Naganishia vaughanmartiniae]|uniref:Uncharacterized protein n=1 Tax=Naganishia vaughanmartiniae TaxID=1424756 RepID=A0ACC2XGS1_9TREE|nr:hypothetical protein QFC22_001414 [Naganishia vaughanmartiniae]